MNKSPSSNKSNAQAQAKDLQPKKDVKGGGLLLPAVQKVRELGGR